LARLQNFEQTARTKFAGRIRVMRCCSCSRLLRR
jgi:hypothetical protein